MFSYLRLEGIGPIKETDVSFSDLTVICGKNGVGKTYLSYSYYILSQLVRDKMLELCTLDGLKRELEKISPDVDGVFRSEVEFSLYDIGLDFHALMRAVNVEFGGVLLQDELRLDRKPGVSVGIDESRVYEDLVSFGGSLNFAGDDHQSRISTKSGSEHFIFEATIKAASSFDVENFQNEISWFVKYFLIRMGLKTGAYSITSERTGISLFHRELSSTPISFDGAAIEKMYASPIQDNIRVVKRGRDSDRPVSEELLEILEDILGGKYSSEGGKRVHFCPSNSSGVRVPIETASGSSKALYLFDRFVHSAPDEVGLLIVDEPELNLHLDAQRKIARLLAAISNTGVKVVVTTHSDHFVREINNLVMMSSDKVGDDLKSELMQQSGIRESSILHPDGVAAYVLDSETRTALPMPVEERGIRLELFNKEIMDSAEISQDLLDALQG